MPHLVAAMTRAKNNIQHIPLGAAHILISYLSDVSTKANNTLTSSNRYQIVAQPTNTKGKGGYCKPLTAMTLLPVSMNGIFYACITFKFLAR